MRRHRTASAAARFFLLLTSAPGVVACLVLAACVSEARMPSGCIAPANPGGGWDFSCRAVSQVLGARAPGGQPVHVTHMRGEGGAARASRGLRCSKGSLRTGGNAGRSNCQSEGWLAPGISGGALEDVAGRTAEGAAGARGTRRASCPFALGGCAHGPRAGIGCGIRRLARILRTAGSQRERVSGVGGDTPHHERLARMEGGAGEEWARAVLPWRQGFRDVRGAADRSVPHGVEGDRHRSMSMPEMVDALPSRNEPRDSGGPVTKKPRFGAVLRGASGNFLEMYDFIVYGYYAVYIGKTFFPAGSEFASLMLSLMTFGVGYLMRPVGAIVLGAYIDRRGRRQGLIVTLGLMAIGTLTIAVTPSYAAIGLAAPIAVVIGRLLQGLSAGVELGGVSVYLAEIATPRTRGFYCSWQSASQQLAVVFTALIALVLTGLVTTEQLSAWGWRIPLLIGCFIIPVILFLRRSLEETEAFVKMKHHARRASDVFRIVASHWRIVLSGMLLAVFSPTSSSLIPAYTPPIGT